MNHTIWGLIWKKKKTLTINYPIEINNDFVKHKQHLCNASTENQTYDQFELMLTSFLFCHWVSFQSPLSLTLLAA